MVSDSRLVPQPLILQGPLALSSFRLDKLRARLTDAGVPIGPNQRLSAVFLHAVALARPLTGDERQVLDRLLTYGEVHDRTSQETGVPAFVAMPRIGTISPWSSKATDIARNCGLGAVHRIERLTAFVIEGADVWNADERMRALRQLHDPMTESVAASLDEVAALFAEQRPQPLTTVPLLAGGRPALEAADHEMGLALSADEIDYLAAYFATAGRDPTDVELMMFAQANSEHCRHKIFNARWTIDGVPREHSLFDMIRHTHRVSPRGTVVAYADNAAVMAGARIERFFPGADGRYAFVEDDTHILMKVETHNHPTAIAPWPGAATGSGGEIRDEGATGIGAKPKAGLTGFSVSHLRIPGWSQPWEGDVGKPVRIASALTIMLDGPIGGAAFNNEFGRINLCGYFRSYEQRIGDVVRGYHKPIMIAGGVGNIRAGHTHKKPLSPGTLLVQLGGPGMRIGLGGGAASSMAAGSNDEALDFDSVQRANPEMQRRCQEVIDACWALGDDNPILSIHDVGAGGVSNALPELAHSGGVGAVIDLRALPSLEPGMSPREIWSNEAQERYVLAMAPESLARFEALCARERCPFAVVGTATARPQLIVNDPLSGNAPVDMELQALLGKPPRMHREVVSRPHVPAPFAGDGIPLHDAITRVLRHPTVADKSFLITIGDRSVGGLTARDQFVGPWQVPVADCAVTLMGFASVRGEAMAMGERTPIAALDAPASGRMAVGEAITNLAAADVESIGDIKLSANWMAACGVEGEDAALYATVEAVGMELCPALGIGIPVGKDSLSMRTAWREGDQQRSVVAPVSLIVSAFAPVVDATRTLTPLLAPLDGQDGEDASETELLLIDLGAGRQRMGGSILAQSVLQEGGAPPDLDEPRHLAQFFAAVRALARAGIALAYHDRSDGGLLATVAEMMFASHRGVTLYLDEMTFAPREADVDGYDVAAGARKLGENEAMLRALFNEELGAVLHIRRAARGEAMRILREHGIASLASVIGHPNDSDELRLFRAGHLVFSDTRTKLQRVWSETSHRLQALRDNPETAQQEYDRLLDAGDRGLFAHLTFDPRDDVAAPFVARDARPRVAILREQGVNGQIEMAHAFTRVGFDAVDVHMSDIVAGRIDLASFRGMAACGGFSYGDVLGAGEGWAKSILFNARARAVFEAFFQRRDAFALGVCNGCQMMSNLSAIIPGAEQWPHFERNRSEQYEARTVVLRLRESPSIFFAGMAESALPVATAHGEGRAVFRDAAQQRAAQALCAAEFVDGRLDGGMQATERFPANPNGSPVGMTAFTTPDGRVTIMMPHPERVVLTVNLSWHPDGWPAESPWLRMFRNARVWVG